MRMRMRPVVAALVAVGVLGTASCAGGSTRLRGLQQGGGGAVPAGQPGTAAQAGAAQPANAGQSGGAAGAAQAAGGVAAGRPAAAVPQALKFQAKTLGGQPFQGASLAGRPVVLWFWAPWCATCAGQAWSVADMVKKYGDRVSIVGVAGLGDAAAMRDFVNDYDLGNTTQLNDQPGAVWRRFKIKEQSTYVIFDRDGKLLHQGWMDDQDFEAKVAALAA